MGKDCLKALTMSFEIERGSAIGNCSYQPLERLPSNHQTVLVVVGGDAAFNLQTVLAMVGSDKTLNLQTVLIVVGSY
jgi:hypothetical protein